MALLIPVLLFHPAKGDSKNTTPCRESVWLAMVMVVMIVPAGVVVVSGSCVSLPDTSAWLTLII
jgi:hypothetical protein